MSNLTEEIIKPIEKFVKKELKDNCSLWDAEPEKFSPAVFRSIEAKLGILQLPTLVPDDFPQVASEITRLISYGCGAVGFIYSTHFSIISTIREHTDELPDDLTLSPIILDEDDWLFFFEKENKFAGRLGGIIGGDLASFFFLPITRSDETRGWILVKGSLAYSEETRYLPGLKPLKTGQVEFERFKIEKELAYIPEGEWFEEFKSWFLFYQLAFFQGLVENAYEIAREYATERKQSGRPIIEIPSVKRLFSQIESTISLLRTARNGFSREKGWIYDIRKLYLGIVDPAEEALLNSIQTMGGYGYMQDYKVERILRDFRSARSIFSPLEYI